MAYEFIYSGYMFKEGHSLPGQLEVQCESFTQCTAEQMMTMMMMLTMMMLMLHDLLLIIFKRLFFAALSFSAQQMLLLSLKGEGVRSWD